MNKNQFKNTKETKNATIETPEWLADAIQEKVGDIFDQFIFSSQNVLDLCCGDGALSKPLIEHCNHAIDTITGIDKNNYQYGFRSNLNFKKTIYRQMDFLNPENDNHKTSGVKYDLILCNPPWNGAPKRKLFSELVVKAALDYLDDQGFMVLITNSNFYNEGRARMKWINEKLFIFKILFLPFHNVFPGIHQAAAVLFFSKRNDDAISYYRDYFEIGNLLEK